MTVTAVTQTEGAVVDRGWLEPTQILAGEDADVYGNVCVYETTQQPLLLQPQHCLQQTHHQVQQMQAAVETVGLSEY